MDKKTGTRAPRSADAGSFSTLNLILLYLTLVGLGAIGGYISFYSLFHNRCADLLNDAERRHNETQQALQERYMGAVEKHHECLQDETKTMELFDLRGRLDGQAALVGKHQSLLDKHQEGMERLSDMQTAHEQALTKISTLEDEIQKKEAELTAMKETAGLDRQNGQLESCQTIAESIQTKIQNRQNYLCQSQYGSGPYYVQFDLSFEDEEASAFVIELPTRKQMPHSVYTFLSMIEAGLYEETALVSPSKGVLKILRPPPSAAALRQKSKGLGFGDAPLTFEEDSRIFPCGPYSVGFVGLGPSLEIFVADFAAVENRICLGRVVRGMQALSRVLSANGELVAVSKTQVLSVDQMP